MNNNGKKPFAEEDSRLVELAIAASSRTLPVKVGVPSPPHNGSPGTYFGAITILNWLMEEDLIDPDLLLERLREVQK